MNFIEIDRSILKTIGFKCTSTEQKDRNGNIIIDETGNPKLKFDRHDYNNAIRCLRKMNNFVEGTSFDDENAHFVIKMLKTTHNKRGGSHYKQSIWIRQEQLEQWIQIANHSKRFMKQKKSGFVYFIHQEADFKRFKIGYTTNLAERLQTLQTGTPDLLVVYKTIENVTKKKEKQLHHLFSQHHIRGEWFAITPDMFENL